MCTCNSLQIILLNENHSHLKLTLDNTCLTCHNGTMIEELEFIEQLENIKNLILASPEKYTNIHVIKYIDILIDIHEKRFNTFQNDMEKEYKRKGI